MKRTPYAQLVMLAALILSFSLVSTHPAHAGGGAWEAWLYDSSTGHGVRVSDQGEPLQDLILPNNDVGSTYSRYIAVSRDGRLIAYTVAAGTTDPLAGFNDGDETLLIYDTERARVVYTEALPAGALSGLQYGGTPYQFDEAGNSFAYGYGILSGEAFTWQVRAITLVGDNPAPRILDSADLVGRAISEQGYLIPVVQRFDEFDVNFLLLYGASEGSWRYPAYDWNFINFTLTPTERLYTPGADQNALGDAIMPASDPAFPQSEEPLIGFPITNTLQAWAPAGSLTRTFAVTPGVIQVSFAQSGEAIAYTEFSPSASVFTALRVIGRDGAALGSIPSQAFNLSALTDMANTVGGFVFTATLGQDDALAGTSLYEVYTRPGSPDLMTPVLRWQGAPGEEYRQIGWISTGDATPAEAVPDWASVSSGAASPFAAEPQSLPQSLLPNPTQGALFQRDLSVNGAAVVTTTEGDTLNVRAEASRSAAIVTALTSGTVVTIIGGPMQADGLTWWNIALPNGTSGWAVDFIDTTRTLTGL